MELSRLALFLRDVEVIPFVGIDQSLSLVTTLGFEGRTEEALRHYQDALGAEVLYLMRFRDAPDQSHCQPGMEDLIFHATFRVLGTVFMASDVGYVDSDSKPLFAGFALLLQMDSADAAQRAFDALSDKGHVVVPLGKSMFTSMYGIVTDRFGVSWKLNVGNDGD